MNCTYKIEYSNSCDIDDWIFSQGFIGVIYLEGHMAETFEDLFQEGEENGEGDFVRSYQRGIKQYIFRTGLLPSHVVELLYFLRLMDTVELTLLTGEVVQMHHLEVTHTWQFDDKQEATVELKFDMDEILISTACCIL